MHPRLAYTLEVHQQLMQRNKDFMQTFNITSYDDIKELKHKM